MSQLYRAEIKPLNAEKIGTAAHGYVEFIKEGESLQIKLEMFDTPANIQHWEHSTAFLMVRKLIYQRLLKIVMGMAGLIYQRQKVSRGQPWSPWTMLPIR